MVNASVCKNVLLLCVSGCLSTLCEGVRPCLHHGILGNLSHYVACFHTGSSGLLVLVRSCSFWFVVATLL